VNSKLPNYLRDEDDDNFVAGAASEPLVSPDFQPESVVENEASSDEQDSRRAWVLDQLKAIRVLREATQLRDAEVALGELIHELQRAPDLEELLAVAQAEKPKIEVLRAEIVRHLQTQIDEELEAPLILVDTPYGEVLRFRDYLDEARQLIDESAEQREVDIRDWLAQWERVIVEGATDPQYNRRVHRVSERIAREKQRLYVGQVRELCERIWAYAEEQKAQRIAPTTIVEIYKAAEDAANLALGRYPEDSILKTLDIDAKNKRVREAVANQIKTSAVQEGEYERALADLNGLADDYEIPDYNFLNVGGQLTEQFTGRITVKRMREQLEKQAKDWALAKKDEYIADAELALADHNPLAAEKALDQNKVDRLFKFLTQSAERGDVQRVQQRIRDEKRNLEAAEKLARDAQSKATIDPFEAWRLYEQAYAEYQWAEILRETRTTIVDEFRRRLHPLMNSAQKAFDERRINDLTAQVDAIVRQFRQLDDPILEQQVERAQKWVLDAEEIERQKQNLGTQLDRLERQLVNSDPEDLQIELDQLKLTFARVIGETPKFDNIAEKISLRQSAERQTEQIKKMLDEKDYARVEREVQKARTVRAEHPEDDVLRAAVDDLEVHYEFLKGQREMEAGQLDRAVEIFQRVQRMTGHRDRARAEELYDEADLRRKEQARAGDRLNSVEARLATDAVAVYEELAALGVLADRALDKRRENLLERAKSEAQATLLGQLRDWKKPNVAPDPAKVRSALEGLQILGANEEHTTYSSYFEPVLLAQEASALAKSAAQTNNAIDWRESIGLYETAVERARELRTEKKLLSNFERDLQIARRAYIRLHLASTQIKAESLSSDEATVSAVFSEIETMLKIVSEANRTDGEVALWSAQLSEMRAKYSAYPEQRQKWFKQAEAEGKNALGLLQQKAGNETARTLIAKSAKGLALARVMLEIDADFAAQTPERLRGAQNKWKENLEPVANDAHDDYFHPLKTWWQDRLKVQMGGSGTSDDFVRADNTLILSLVLNRLLFDVADPTAIKLINNLDISVSRLLDKIDKSIQGATTAKGVVGNNGMAQLATQLSQIKESKDDINGMANLIQYFEVDYPFSQTIKSAYSQFGYQIESLGQVEQALNDLSHKLQTALQQLNTDRVTGAFGETEKLMQSVSPSYGSHPSTIQVSGEIKAAQTERASLVKKLDELQSHIQSGNYGVARRGMREIGLRLAATYGLATRLKITQAKTGEVTSLWTEVENKLLELGGALDTIVEFAAPFDSYETVDGMQVGRITGEAKPARVVLDWEAQSAKALVAVELGEFEQARRLFRETLTGSDRLGIGLQIAVDRLERPPNGTGDSVEARYLAAERSAAASERALMMLRTLQSEYLALFSRQRNEANSALDEIDTREQQWHAGLDSWEKAIHDIATQFQKAGGVTKRPRGRAIKDAIESAVAAFKSAHAACSTHPYLVQMIDLQNWESEAYRGLWLFRQAAVRTGLKRPKLS